MAEKGLEYLVLFLVTNTCLAELSQHTICYQQMFNSDLWLKLHQIAILLVSHSITLTAQTVTFHASQFAIMAKQKMMNSAFNCKSNNSCESQEKLFFVCISQKYLQEFTMLKSFSLISQKQKCQYALNRLFILNYAPCSVYVVNYLICCQFETTDSLNAHIQLSEIPVTGAASGGQQ